MNRITGILLIAIMCILFSLPATAYANAAEPPVLIVILSNAPPDAEVSMIYEGNETEGREKRAAWETIFAFYNYDLRTDRLENIHDVSAINEITLRVSGNGTNYEQKIDKRYLSGYNSIVTLDFEQHTLKEGKLLSRSILLITLRVTLTLIIEGLIFFAFGFRRRSSWIAFLVINLLTQGVLNVLLNHATPFTSYLIFNLILMEFGVFFIEIISFVSFVKEHNKLRRASYAFIANLASLILGGYLITALPV